MRVQFHIGTSNNERKKCLVLCLHHKLEGHWWKILSMENFWPILVVCIDNQTCNLHAYVTSPGWENMFYLSYAVLNVILHVLPLGLHSNCCCVAAFYGCHVSRPSGWRFLFETNMYSVSEINKYELKILCLFCCSNHVFCWYF